MKSSLFEFYSPLKIVSGRGALENTGFELEQQGCSRPMLLSEPGIVSAGLVKKFKSAFRDGRFELAAEYYDIPQDSALDVVNKIAALFREKSCDSLIALGGGSVIDTAKGVNILLSEGAEDIASLMGAELLKKPMKPLIAIPTTAGTGSEATLVAVIADRERQIKMPFTSYRLIPDVAILDPRMTMSLPPLLTAITGMDALTHAIEAYTCLQKNPVSDAFAFQAVKMISQALPQIVSDGENEALRMTMANAALMAGIAFSNSMVGIVHSMGHAAGSVAGVPHGLAMSILLPYGMEYNFDFSKEHYAELLLPLGGAERYAATPPEERAGEAIAVVYELRQTLHNKTGMVLNLKDAGVAEAQLAEIAKKSLNDGSLIFNPREAHEAAILNLLRQAW
jgi:alcohol dehydrogenase